MRPYSSGDHERSSKRGAFRGGFPILLSPVLGRHGLHVDNPVGRAMRDMRITSIGGGADEGDAQHHRQAHGCLMAK